MLREQFIDGEGFATLLHEIAHQAHRLMELLAEGVDVCASISLSYEQAVKTNAFCDSYAMQNEREYFAQGKEAFDCLVRAHEDLITRYYKQPLGYEDKDATTRSWLARRDKTLFDIVEQVIACYEAEGDALVLER